MFPEKDLAGGACMGEGVLIDISDPVNPYVITSVTDTNFAFWHSATFTNDANAVIFTDELGGGGGATCVEALYPERGANAYFDIVGEAADVEEAVTVILREHPDVVLLDVHLPGGDARARAPRTPRTAPRPRAPRSYRASPK